MSIQKQAARIIMMILPVVIFITTHAHAQKYTPTDNGSKVQFKIVNHLMLNSTVTGYFKGLQGVIIFNPDDLKSSSVDVSVAVGTISTGIGKRDKDLKKEEYFNADKFPRMHVRSTSITASGKGMYVLSGALTIRGITKNISIPFTAAKSGNGYLFKGSFKLNRTDYKVGDTKKIAEDVDVALEVAAQKQ